MGIESSCDETAAAVVQKGVSGVEVLSNIVATSLSLQAKFGGIIPEQAAREQLKSITAVIQEALQQAFPNLSPVACRLLPPVDAIAVTQGPGLIGSLLVGVEVAKSLSLTWNKPLVPVNHLIGHFYANWLEFGQGVFPHFPALGLLVSGGHTDLILLKCHGRYDYLGGTRDDAAGECFDKTARLLDLPYPGGPAISKLAEEGNPDKYRLPKPMSCSKDLDFSFSGLKTAVANLTETLRDEDGNLDPQTRTDLAASIEKTVAEVLIEKTIRAAQRCNVGQILVAGGVAANQKLSQTLKKKTSEQLPHVEVLIPPPSLCTDNAAYIGAAALYNFHPAPPLSLQANPSLSLRKNTVPLAA
ncbi:MAG: tRNA (adenosine(37)-N6)-threonylcarbamoyltransferase complex transferase subunit TsaD [Firmicutes bacterium]|nr:tRNA (adenosine(37)-N6)-threonylcarbamoyltransferase complex transferase subunit TsaD [Bacillota bacterium]